MVRLEAREGKEVGYEEFYQYLATRDRFAVVGNFNKKKVKVKRHSEFILMISTCSINCIIFRNAAV